MMIEDEVTETTEHPAEEPAGAAQADAEARVSDEQKEEAEVDAQQAEAAREVKVVDKRRFARLLGFGGGAAAEERRVPTYVAQLEEQLERLKGRAAEVEATSRAEVEAARQRLERHFEARLQTARADLVAGLLGVLDTLERALETPGAPESPLYDGILATRDMFVRQLGELGAEPVPALGEPFDPVVHEAVDEVEVSDARSHGRVVVELRRGFKMGDRLVRPAAVRVGRYTGDAGM